MLGKASINQTFVEFFPQHRPPAGRSRCVGRGLRTRFARRLPQRQEPSVFVGQIARIGPIRTPVPRKIGRWTQLKNISKKLAGRGKNRRRHCMKTKSNKIGDNAAQLCFGDPARTAAGKFPTACGDTLRGTRPRIIGKLSSPLDARALAVPTFAITAGRRITGKRNEMKIQTHQRTLASPVNMRWAHGAHRPTSNPPTQSDHNAENNPTGATSL